VVVGHGHVSVSATAPVVVVGDALLDRDLTGRIDRLAPDAPVPVVEDLSSASRPGGAGLAAALAAMDGRDVTLVTALGDDAGGDELRGLLASRGVDVVDLGLRGTTPEKVRLGGSGVPLARLDYGGRSGAAHGPLPASARSLIEAAGVVLVADYGRGLTGAHDVGAAIASRAGRRRQPFVWDPHPRGAPPVEGATVVTPNRAEAGLDALAGVAEVAAAARAYAGRTRAAAVAVTLGPRGALFVEGAGTPLAVPPSHLATGDPCGAGDRFASALAIALADGALPSEAVVVAVEAATAFVAAGGVTAWMAHPTTTTLPPDAEGLVASVRQRGGTVVATGGCFDLLHAGHVRGLQAARALGDCLVVCLNSDASVRRLKGEGRPLQPQDDRAAVLLGLGCVDAVTVFDDDTPANALAWLRPDVFAKGGDYSAPSLPEAALLASWGAQVVVLPYLEGRSTTRLVAGARHG
jgi:rfaE bifunctional protein nucleotidyltransferase chain/domain/rfaE bifunctional protein kinase chain/domain